MYNLNSQVLFIIILIGYLLLHGFESSSQVVTEKKILYLIPGQGSDERLFKNLEFDSAMFDIRYIKWAIPDEGEDLKSFASRLSTQIDTTKVFYLIGVSLGGMVATEINEILTPKKVIIVSSAKCRNELPSKYRFQKSFPVYKIVPKKLIKQSTFIVQPLFEPDRRNEKETCNAMLEDKSPVFLKRTIEMIVNWERTDYDSCIIQIHGNNDHTIPIKNVDYDFLIEDGSHMMILTQTPEINELILSIIQDEDSSL